MGFFKNSALAATALLAISANAHMVMKSPVPYGKSSLTNSPLAADGSDFPCKQRPGVYDAEGAQNIMAIGEPQTLSFTGSAVHGGGSCQVALTTDLQPTKDSKWMVIKSIVGGCPANVAGNLPADPNGNGASTFQYTIPDGIAPGDYTISWSWMNKIGNREWYQNCGPATVVGAKRRRYEPAPKVSELSKRQANFPDLCVANLASVNGLTTEEGKEYVFSNGGADVQTAGQGPYQTLDCGGSGGNAVVPTASGSASQPSGQPAGQPSGLPSGQPNPPVPQSSGTPGFASPSNPVASAPVVSPSPPVPSQAGSPAIFASGASASLAVTPVNPPAAAGATASAAAGNSSSGSSAGVQSGPCSQEGAWACSADGMSFQRCASGSWSSAMALSSGMKCTPGISSTIDMTPGKRHLHGHIRKASSFELNH